MTRGGGWLRGPVERLGPLTVGFFVLVMLASGGTGLTLLLWPGSTERYFSWSLSPVAAAGLIGGFYLSSAVLFGWALTTTWTEARSLCVGVYGLTVPTLASTIVHDEVFDFGRWQAITWWVLFIAAPPAITIVLIANRERPIRPERALPGWTRATLGGLSLILGALAVLLLFDPTRSDLSAPSPVALVGLTGAYLGAWCSFNAVLVGWAALRGTREEARVPLAALALASIGAGVAATRSFGDLDDRSRIVLLLALALLAALGITLSNGTKDRSPAATS